MKKAIVTISIGGSANAWGRWSHFSFRAYAKKVGADFIVIGDKDMKIVLMFLPNDYYPKTEEFQIKEFFNHYERIFYIDTDAFIKPNCPDIFEMVPFDKIGGVYDNKENMLGDQHRIKMAMEKLEKIKWESGYINCGVFVVSNVHKEIFNISKDIPVMQIGEQSVLNYNIHKYGFEIHKLNTKFNAMFLYGYSTNGKIEDVDVDAYIVHFAACGRREERLKFLYEKYKDEITRGLA